MMTTLLVVIGVIVGVIGGIYLGAVLLMKSYIDYFTKGGA